MEAKVEGRIRAGRRIEFEHLSVMFPRCVTINISPSVSLNAVWVGFVEFAICIVEVINFFKAGAVLLNSEYDAIVIFSSLTRHAIKVAAVTEHQATVGIAAISNVELVKNGVVLARRFYFID